MALLTSLLESPLRGALKPRVETHPEYVFSYGAEAAELMARAGRPLDAWQVDAVTLMLSVRTDGKWACFEHCEWVSRQNGKGGILEARALAGFLLLGEKLIMWSAHEYKTAMEAFRRVRALIKALGTQVGNNENLWLVDGIGFDEETGEPRETQFIVKINNTNGEEGFERLDTEARIKFIARSKGSGRGFSGDVNIIDETFAYTTEQHSALLYTMSARPNPQIIYTSSPPLSGDTGEIMFELRRRGDPTAPRDGDDGPWEQDPALAYRDWGLAGDLDDLDAIDLDDIANAATTNPALSIRITLETIQRELRSDRAGYPRERLGIWPREVRSRNGVISAEQWADLGDPESKRVGEVAIAVDVSPERDGAIAICGRRGDGLAHWELIENRPGTDWIVARMVALKAKHRPVVIAIDGKGPSGSLVSDLMKAGIKPSADPQEPRHGDLLITGPQDMADAWGKFVDATKQRIGRHRDQVALTSALLGAKVRAIGDGGSAWGRKGSDSIAPIVAVTLAHYAYEVRAHLVVEVRAPNVW